MIVVIADDLTGASEIGGIGLRYGLRTDVAFGVVPQSKADLLVISMDTRSMPEAAAIEQTHRITSSIKALHPDHIFKKVDSVLRGYMVAEVAAHLHELGLSSALIVPCNPSLGRVIKDGVYYVNGVPLHQTGFANDPEFPVITANVEEILANKNLVVAVKKHIHNSPHAGLIIGEAENTSDLEQWAALADQTTFTGGGAEFFNAFLQSLGHQLQKQYAAVSLNRPVLVVSGTAYGANCNLLSQLKAAGGPVDYIAPHRVTITSPIIKQLADRGKAIIAPDPADQSHDPDAVRAALADITQQIFTSANIPELIIEGGSTASAILENLGFREFTPVQEFAQGVIRMQSKTNPDLYITLKPGSYTWPDALSPDLL